MNWRHGAVAVAVEVQGYVFPKVRADVWDTDWLNVRVTVEHGGLTHTATGVAFTSSELVGLVGWLDEVRAHVDLFGGWAHGHLTSRFSGLRADLGFEARSDGGRGAMALRVCLGRSFQPPWRRELHHDPAQVEPPEVWWDFPADTDEVARVLGEAREALRRFPVRRVPRRGPATV